MCASPAVIGRSTNAELARLKVGDHPIPTLASLLDLVKGRVPLLLEAKVDREIWRWVPALRRDLAGYGGRLGVMSFDPRLPRLLRTNLPNVLRGLVVRDSLPAWRRWLAMRLAAPDFLAVDRAALGRPWVVKARGRMPVYAWTIRAAAERAQAAVQADALIWEADGRP